MKIIESIEEVQEYCKELKKQGKTAAIIDTFGDLHMGHTSVINTAKSNADAVILSVWHSLRQHSPVDHLNKPENPKENLENLLKYKQEKFNSDVELCELNKVDLFWNFIDEWDFLSEPDIVTPVLTPSLKQFLEKHYRSSNCNIQVWIQILKTVKPDIIVLGEKDFYQKTILSFAINALNIPVEVVISPTVRDSDGIAYSSRNKFLSSGERRRAAYVYKTLKEISEWSSYPTIEEIKKHFKDVMENVRARQVFIDIYENMTLKPMITVDKEATIVVAAQIGEVCIWDSIVITPH